MPPHWRGRVSLGGRVSSSVRLRRWEEGLAGRETGVFGLVVIGDTDERVCLRS